jgi:hypothetical protein
MEVKCLEIRDANTFIPVICIRPVPANEEFAIIGRLNPRTHRVAHHYITEHWHELADGDVIELW